MAEVDEARRLNDAKISAVDDMYDALKEITEANIDYIRINHLGPAENNLVIRQAKAALAKARGE